METSINRNRVNTNCASLTFKQGNDMQIVQAESKICKSKSIPLWLILQKQMSLDEEPEAK